MLNIKLVEGVLFRDTETFTKMDPYMVFQVNGKKYKSRVLQEAGQQPVWKEDFSIPFCSAQDEVVLQCFDEDILVDDLVGEETYKVGQLCQGRKYNAQWFQINYKGESAGNIYMEIRVTERAPQLGRAMCQRISIKRAQYQTQIQKQKGNSPGEIEKSGEILKDQSHQQKILESQGVIGYSCQIKRREEDHEYQKSQNNGLSTLSHSPDLAKFEGKSKYDFQDLEEVSQNQCIAQEFNGTLKRQGMRIIEDQSHQVNRETYLAKEGSYPSQDLFQQSNYPGCGKQQNSGILQITIVRALILHDEDFSEGKIDPFIQISYKSFKRSTMIRHCSGLNPTWDEEFSIKLDDYEDLITLSCFDKDLFMNDLIGESSLKVSELVEKFGGGDRYATLYHDGQKSVHLLMKATYQAESRASHQFSQYAPAQVSQQKGSPFIGGYSPQLYQQSQLSSAHLTPKQNLRAICPKECASVTVSTPTLTKSVVSLKKFDGHSFSRNGNIARIGAGTMALAGMSISSNIGSIQGNQRHAPMNSEETIINQNISYNRSNQTKLLREGLKSYLL